MQPDKSKVSININYPFLTIDSSPFLYTRTDSITTSWATDIYHEHRRIRCGCGKSISSLRAGKEHHTERESQHETCEYSQALPVGFLPVKSFDGTEKESERECSGQH
jgi:hypothetical protein